MYIFTQPLRHEQNVTQFLNGLLLAWILSFPSPRRVAVPKLKIPVCPTIYHCCVRERTEESMPSGRELTRSQMQTVSSRPWIRVVYSILYDNPYAKCASENTLLPKNLHLRYNLIPTILRYLGRYLPHIIMKYNVEFDLVFHFLDTLNQINL